MLEQQQCIAADLDLEQPRPYNELVSVMALLCLTSERKRENKQKKEEKSSLM